MCSFRGNCEYWVDKLLMLHCNGGNGCMSVCVCKMRQTAMCVCLHRAVKRHSCLCLAHTEGAIAMEITQVLSQTVWHWRRKKLSILVLKLRTFSGKHNLTAQTKTLWGRGDSVDHPDVLIVWSEPWFKIRCLSAFLQKLKCSGYNCSSYKFATVWYKYPWDLSTCDII